MAANSVLSPFKVRVHLLPGIVWICKSLFVNEEVFRFALEYLYNWPSRGNVLWGKGLGVCIHKQLPEDTGKAMRSPGWSTGSIPAGFCTKNALTAASEDPGSACRTHAVKSRDRGTAPDHSYSLPDDRARYSM